MISTGKIFSFWGSSNGLLRYLAPETRLICGLFILISCIISSFSNYYQLITIPGGTFLWCAFAGIRTKKILSLIFLCIILFCPFFLFIPLSNVLPNVNIYSLEKRSFIIGGIVLKSSCTLFLSVATISSINYTEMYEALRNLHLPNIICTIIVQVINQLLFMIEETKRVILVLILRGVSHKSNLKIIFSFPVVWLVKILFRVHRLSIAMYIRGYDENSFKYFSRNISLKKRDWLVISISMSYLVFSVFLQIKEKL